MPASSLRGDPQNGWDTDQFPDSVEELTPAMLEIIRVQDDRSGWKTS